MLLKWMPPTYKKGNIYIIFTSRRGTFALFWTFVLQFIENLRFEKGHLPILVS